MEQFDSMLSPVIDKTLGQRCCSIIGYQFSEIVRCIKAFVFRFISVPAKWIMTAWRYVLNIYTENGAYVKPFKTEIG